MNSGDKISSQYASQDYLRVVNCKYGAFQKKLSSLLFCVSTDFEVRYRQKSVVIKQIAKQTKYFGGLRAICFPALSKVLYTETNTNKTGPMLVEKRSRPCLQ
jgi:hypothetical protein